MLAREADRMTTIKATCPSCGEVELTGDDIELMVCPSAPLSYYAFQCPSCADRVRKPADDHIVSLLISGGVDALTWEIPAEAMEVHAGAQLSYDDLLDFALWLGMSDDLARLADSPAHR
jgi:predicted RNA-binding Zn-ribbon protein involved in translation (DUF1610 family)